MHLSIDRTKSFRATEYSGCALRPRRIERRSRRSQKPPITYSTPRHCALREPRCLLLLAADLMRAAFGGTPRPGMTEREHPMKLR
jgi:hypothetical protein